MGKYVEQNRRATPLDWRILDEIPKKYDLYDYQQVAVDSFINRSHNFKTSCIVSGTGTGKSVMIQEIVRVMQVKTVIVPPKKILCEQLFEEF
jgi:superfamily II DNA or RNA helicase